MTAARTPLLLAFLVALIPGVSQAQEREVPVTREDTLRVFHDHVISSVLHPRGEALTHPVNLALQLSGALDLAADQVEALERVRREFEALFMGFILDESQEALRPTIWWDGDDIDGDELRRNILRAAERQADLMLEMLRLRDQVFELLTDDQRAQLHARRFEKLGDIRHDMSGARHMPPCEEGSGSARTQLSDRVQMGMHVTFQGDSTWIDGVVIARGERPLRHAQAPPAPAERPLGVPGHVMGAWFVGLDRQTRQLWIGSRFFELGDPNVVLIQGVDDPQERPEVVATLALPPIFFTGGCRDGIIWVNALRSHLLDHADIRDFVGR